MKNNSQKYPVIPIAVGITGHIDLINENIYDLEYKVRKIFIDIKKKYPHTPIKILSPLAEGADRLVAKIGLEEGASLYAILPFPKRYYMKDFKGKKSKNEFNNFLSKAEKIIELSIMEGSTNENIQKYGEQRNIQYEKAGAFIVNHSQILIALWNGIEINATGGTSQIVKFKLNGIPEPYINKTNPLYAVDNGPVLHIFSPRSKKNINITRNTHNSEVECITERGDDWDTLYPVLWKNRVSSKDENDIILKAKTFYHNTLLNIENFNIDAFNFSRYKKKNIEKSKAGIISSKKKISQGLQNILEFYAIADTMAIHYQNNTRKSLITLMCLAVFGFTIITVFDEFFVNVITLLLFPISFIFAYWVFIFFNKKNYENKFYDYRTLAEGLRIQFFWKIMRSKNNITDYYFKKFNGEIDWIDFAIKAISIEANNDIYNRNKTKNSSEKNKKIVFNYQNWILDQKNYFIKSSNRKSLKVKKQQQFTTLLFFLSIIAALFLILIHAINIYMGGEADNILDMRGIAPWNAYHFIQVIISFLLASGAYRANYVQTMAFAEEAKQYQRMNVIFSNGEKHLISYINDKEWDEAQKLIIEMGKEVISENMEWLLTQRSKPIEVPKG